jgi:hypothetical protein
MFRSSIALAVLLSASTALAQGASQGAPPSPPAGSKPAPAPSKGLDRATISAGIAKIKPQVTACGDANKDASGTVKVTAKVAPDGKVTSATQQGASTPKLGDCVVGVFKKATFAKTDAGGSFTYPFVFGTSKPPTAGAGSGSAAPPPTTIPPVPPGQGSGATPSPGGATLPASLDRTAISAGIAKAKPQIMACGKASPSAKGKVKLRVTVAASGVVTTASVDETPDPKLGACVAGAVQKTSFDRTQQGGAFSYPFVF